MWGQKWGQMSWNAVSSVPALGGWAILLLGCLLGIVAVLCLRSARKVGLMVSLLMLLIPLSALAGVPFIFVSGTVADAAQVNQNFAAVIPIVGSSQGTGSVASGGSLNIFPPSASFVAPRNLTCLVTISPYDVFGGSGGIAWWQPAMKLGTTITIAPSNAPGPISLVEMPGPIGLDHNYTGTDTRVFSVPAGSSVSFGAHIDYASNRHQTTVNAVYSCTIPP